MVYAGVHGGKNTWAGYARQLAIPAGWEGKRVKLKFHAIYSACEVYVNGKKPANTWVALPPLSWTLLNW
ncbi:sugar-binding domain-containing protein [Niabella hibiscisoli]|uniref:sugar-binding domain-containing protein n=1 Tax=Niabella hibiscisoli TaxID=1825928 RepID=UPI00374CEBB2